MLDQVASKMAQDAIMLTQVGLKMANMASKSKFWLIFDQEMLILEHSESWKYGKKHLFYRSVCNLHFFVSLNAFLGL